MIHEILAALSGSPGDIITVQNDLDSYDDQLEIFAVAPTVSFVSSSERVAINRCVQTGYTFRWLCRAVLQRRTNPSLYVRALAHSVDDAILTEYLDLLVVIESDALSNPGEVTVAHLQSRVRTFDVVFSVLRTIMETMELRRMAGGQVLNLLHRHSNTGMPDVKLRLTKLANHVLGVFYSQLVSWVSHGVLVDDREEFMITQRIDHFEGGASSSSNSSNSSSSSSSSSSSTSSSLSSSRDTVDDPHLLSRTYNPIDSEHEWNTKYTLRLSMVPTEYVRYSFAQKALFVGKAMMVLKKLDPRSLHQCDSSTDGSPPTTDSISTTFASRIEMLRGASEFPSQPLEAALEEARVSVNQRLWWLTVKVAKLTEHLAAIKDYFLLWRGEFYQRLLVESSDMLRMEKSNARTMIDLNVGPLRRAGATVGLEGNVYFERFSLCLYSPEFSIYNFQSIDTHRLTLIGQVETKGGKEDGGMLSEGISNEKSLCLVGSGGGSSGGGSSSGRSSGGGGRRSLSMDERRRNLSFSSPSSPSSSSTSSSLSTSRRAGAAWHTELMVVEYGYDSIVQVTLHPSSTISFVVQTDRLAAIHSDPSTLESSFVVSCTLSSDGQVIVTKVTLRSKMKSKENLTKLLFEMVTEIGVEEGVVGEGVLEEEEKEEKELDGPVHLRLRVVQRRAASQQLDDMCQVYMTSRRRKRGKRRDSRRDSAEESTTTRWRPTQEEGPPLVELPLRLSDELSLSPTANGGGAWIGLIGTTTSRRNVLEAATTSNEASSSRSGSSSSRNTATNSTTNPDDKRRVTVSGWAFEAKPKSTYYAHHHDEQKSGTTTTSTTSNKSSLPSDVGAALEGRYRVAWPIHLVVTQSSLSKYNAMFQFLFSVGRVSSSLRGTWALLMSLKSTSKCAMLTSRLRSRMAFLVDTLQYYFHVDVIASQWHHFEAVLQETEKTFDFDKVQKGHAKFLAAISRQCLLHVRTVRSALDEVLDTCNELCNCVTNHLNDLDNQTTQMEKIDVKFTRCSSYLFLVLSGISEQLLLRLDFNEHYSNQASMLGGAVRMP